MSKDKNKQELVSANIKITKGQVPLARELGITHANFRNKGLNKRLRKEQKERDKLQQRNANKRKLLDNYLQAKKAIETETARHQQAEKEYDSVLEQVMSVPPVPGPLEDVGTFSDNPAETPEQAAKRVMGILGFSGSEDDQSEAASLENTYEACLDIKADRIKLKHVDVDVAATYPQPDENGMVSLDVEKHKDGSVTLRDKEGFTTELSAETVKSWSQRSLTAVEMDTIQNTRPVEETGIDPTLPFDDGTVDTNVDPKNFGVQSVDNDAGEAVRVTGKHTRASDLAFRETTKGFYDGCTKIDSDMDNLCEVIIGAGGFVDMRAPDGSAIIRDPETGWVNRLPAHMVNDTSINDSYPNIPQPLDWDGLKKEIIEQGGVPNVTIMAELPTNEPTGRGFPPIPSEPGCTEVTLMYPGMDSLAGLNPFGGTCGGNRRQMYGNSEGQQSRALVKREFFDKHASEATPEDIGQVFPHHPQEDGPFSHAKFTEGVEGYKIQNSGISGAFVDPNSIHPVYHNGTSHASLTAACRAAFPHRPNHQFDPLLETYSHFTTDDVVRIAEEAAKEANKPQVLDIATGEIRETTGHVVDGKVQYIDDKPKDDSSDKE